jgi:hypothetical protein
MILDCLFIGSSIKKGRGVFTAEIIHAHTIIEVSPVILMTNKERFLLDQTILHDYLFEWGEKRNQCCIALGYASMYNHSYQSNCEYMMDYERDLISIKTMRLIKTGEELFINYNGDWNNKKKVWFDLK